MGGVGVALFILALRPFSTLAQDDDPIRVVHSTAEYNFGQQVTFQVAAAADTPITAVFVFARAAGMDQSWGEPLSFEPGREIALSVDYDLYALPFPAFAEISYWWQIEDAAGNRLTTEAQRFVYSDNRFDWHKTGAAPIYVHWDQGDAVFVQSALDVATSALESLAQDLQAPLPERLDIYVYPTLADLRSALAMTGRDWMGGQARPDLGVVLVAVPPGAEAVGDLQRDVPHELTHMLVYQVTGQGYANVPRWLDEGLAVSYERRPDPGLSLALEQAVAEESLLPLADLCASFSPDATVAQLAYAQSRSVVSFVRTRYGLEGVRRLLSAYADGASCESGVAQALGISFGTLESDWRASLLPAADQPGWLRSAAPWLVLWGLIVLVTVPFVGGRRSRPV